MKNALIAMAIVTVIMTAGGGVISMALSAIVGGGAEQSFIYPIYGGIILLSGIVVGATLMVLQEIRELRKEMEELKGR